MASRTKQAEQLKISSLGDFKARVRGVFELPSGMVVKLKNPGGLQAFIANGTIPNSLLGIVQQSLSGGKKADSLAQVKEMASDLESLSEMMTLLDTITVQTIIEPQCRMAPTPADVERWNLLNPENPKSSPEDLRDDDKYLYTDDIDELDKQFIMQWVTGGTRDLETFRAEHAAGVATLSADEGAGNTPALESGTDNG